MSDDELDPETIEQIKDALAAGRKIDAIKIYREATGLGLVEAKTFIDALLPRLIEQDPERYSKASSSKAGCGAVVLLMAVLGSAILSSALLATIG